MTPDLDSPMFNLIDEPWIPCIRNTGEKAELNLREVLLGAHELSGIYGESPLVIASIYRLLLAMMYSIYGNPSTSSWRKLWQAAANDDEQVNAYLSEWHERFYLFHPERPFYQWAEGAMREKTIVDMLPELSAGNAGTLFDHHIESNRIYFKPAETAKALLLVQTFSVAGGNGLAPRDSSDAPWARGVVFLMEGDTLFQTLMLNFMPASQANLSQDSNIPFWEAENPFAPDRTIPLGFSDYLTWPIRKVFLLPEIIKGKLFVRDVNMGPGLKLNPEFLNPFYHYRIDNKYLMQRFNEERVLWRDSSSFLSFHKQDSFFPPRTLHWISELIGEEIFDASKKFGYMALGMANNQAKVDFFAEEHLPLPASYLRHEEHVDGLRTALEAAENTRKKLYGALAKMATLKLAPTAEDAEGHAPDPKDVKNLINHWAADRQYWAALEAPFFQLLRDLPEEGEAAIHRWDTALQEAARAAFDHAAEMAGNDARALRASVKARGQLAYGLKQLFSTI